MNYAASPSRGVALALLVLQPVVFFRRVLINPDKHIPYDLLGFHTPLADFIAYALRQGEWPLWDPYPYCGYPIHADVQAQLFYPPAWLAIALRNFGSPGTMFYWLEWQVVLHMMLAGLLTFGFARRLGCAVPVALFAGTAFQLGAFFASQAQHLGAVAGTAWLPLAWWAVWELRERFTWRWVWWLAFALALAFLAGFMATALVVWTAALVLVLVLRSWRALPAFVLALPLIGMQLAPAIEWSPWSVASLRGVWNMGAGTPMRAWWSIVVPNYFGVFTPEDPVRFTGDYSYTFLYCYSGLAAVVLWIGSCWRGGALGRWFAGLAALFFVLQCGTFLPGFALLMQWLPVSIRGAVYMNFFLGAACLAMVLAAALGARGLPSRWGWVLALVTAVELVWVSGDRPMNARENSWRRMTSETQVDQSPATARAVERLVRAQNPPWRLDVLDMNYSFTMNASWRRLPTPSGDNPLAPLRVVELRRRFASGEWWERQLPVAKPESALLDFLNVRYLLAHAPAEDGAALARAGWAALQKTENGTRVYANTEVMPRFFLAAGVRGAATMSESLRSVSDAELRREAVVEGGAPAVVSGGSVRVLRYGLNSLTLETSSVGSSLLVSSETFHPGWRVTVDGAPARMLLVNAAFRGVALAGGRHVVAMTYAPGGLGWWCWAAAAFWAFGFWGVVNCKK